MQNEQTALPQDSIPQPTAEPPRPHTIVIQVPPGADVPEMLGYVYHVPPAHATVLTVSFPARPGDPGGVIEYRLVQIQNSAGQVARAILVPDFFAWLALLRTYGGKTKEDLERERSGTVAQGAAGP
jgi:hypothetical protein